MCGKGNSLEWSAPSVGTRRTKATSRVSASHLSHLVVLSVLLSVLTLALGLRVGVLRPPPFQRTYRKWTGGQRCTSTAGIICKLRLWTGMTVPGSGFGGGSLGLLLGVCTLQILMKPAISMMRAMPISSTAHQWAWRTQDTLNKIWMSSISVCCRVTVSPVFGGGHSPLSIQLYSHTALRWR